MWIPISHYTKLFKVYLSPKKLFSPSSYSYHSHCKFCKPLRDQDKRVRADSSFTGNVQNPASWPLFKRASLSVPQQWRGNGGTDITLGFSAGLMSLWPTCKHSARAEQNWIHLSRKTGRYWKPCKQGWGVFLLVCSLFVLFLPCKLALTSREVLSNISRLNPWSGH